LAERGLARITSGNGQPSLSFVGAGTPAANIHSDILQHGHGAQRVFYSTTANYFLHEGFRESVPSHAILEEGAVPCIGLLLRRYWRSHGSMALDSLRMRGVPETVAVRSEAVKKSSWLGLPAAAP
jgi:hypothetical protein